MTVTLDTNVYISAFVFRKGKPYELLQMLVDGDLRVAVSDAIVDELKHVLHVKFHLSAEGVSEIETVLAEFTERVNPLERLEVIGEDPADDRILECAVASQSEVIISGDGDLLRVGSYRGIRIVSPAAFLREWASGAG